MKHFVTLFDSNYLSRGLALYNSLVRYADDFHLWIICFDNLAYELLTKLNLEKATPISLAEFEDEELLKIKPTRTQKEYCWTCTPSVALYILKTQPQIDVITYLDADLMFFSSPEPIFTEAGNASILLTEHRYLPEYNQALLRGIYNVQFMMFKRDEEGLKALNWWRDRCLEWCYAKDENGKFGDQKYLDDWKERFKNVHILEHLGGGVAPWNANQYNLTKINDQIYVEKYPLIFYHFHGVSIYRYSILNTHSEYPFNQKLIDWIYKPYAKEISKAYRQIGKIKPQFTLGMNEIKFPTKLPRRPSAWYKCIKHYYHNEFKQYRYCWNPAILSK